MINVDINLGGRAYIFKFIWVSFLGEGGGAVTGPKLGLGVPLVSF